MTDDQIDRAVRAADPYRPVPLDGAEQSLLEEIMSTPVTVRRRPARRWVAVVATAAAVTGVLAAAPLINRDPDDRAVPPAATSPAPSSSPTPSFRIPRLLVGEPGWKAVTAYDFTDKSGTITFAKGPLRLDIIWYPADQYDAYLKEPLAESAAVPVEVDGWSGSLFATRGSSFIVMLRPHDGTFVQIASTSDGWNRAEFDRVRAVLHRVDTTTWFAAMPPEIVTPARADREAAKILADVPAPPGFDLDGLDQLGATDRYHFVAEVTTRAGCAWITEWMRADDAGDAAAKQKAAGALRGSRNWTALKEIAGEGGWSSVFWDVAAETADGRVPDGYEDTLGCR